MLALVVTEGSRRAGRILVINPNSSEAVTAAIDAAVAPVRMAGGPEIVVDRLRSGPPGIATQRDADTVIMPLCDWVALETRRTPSSWPVSAIPACSPYGKPRGAGPVMGIAEWGLLRALTLGESFGIVALSPSLGEASGPLCPADGPPGLRYAGSWPIDASAEDTAGSAIRGRLTEAARRLAAERGADVLVLGCAGMASHRRAIEDAVGRPVVEPTQWAVAAALGASAPRRCMIPSVVPGSPPPPGFDRSPYPALRGRNISEGDAAIPPPFTGEGTARRAVEGWTGCDRAKWPKTPIAFDAQPKRPH